MRRLFALLVGLAGLPATAAAVGYFALPDATIDLHPADVVLADGDRDGFDDLAASHPNGPWVGIYWNAGLSAPSIGSAARLDMGLPPLSFVFTDLDGDGLADVAATSSGGITDLSVRLQTSARSFAPYTLYGLPPGAPVNMRRPLLAADLDGDGRPELVVADALTFRVFHNRGDGVFDAFQDAAAPGVLVVSLAAGNLDGRPGTDVLVAREDGVQAYLNDGAGTLVPGPFLATGRTEADIVALDLDRDGVLDAVSVAGGGAQLLLNDGTGTFRAGASVPAPGGQTASRAHDVNGDGVADVVVAADSGVLTVLYSTGAQALVSRVDRALPALDQWRLAIGDLNGDGDGGDLIPADLLGNVRFRVSAGAALLAQDSYRVGQEPVSVALGDLDGDGHVDLATADAGTRTVTLLLNRGDGTFAAWQTLPLGVSPSRVVVTDLDRDGWKDLVVLAAPAPSDPVAGLAPAASFPGKLLVMRNLGGALFDAPRGFSTGLGPTALTVADLDGDLLPDAAVANGAAGTLSLLRGTGGGFSTPSSLAVGLGPTSLASADLDGDGDRDLVVCAPDGQAVVLRNDGGLRFTEVARFAAGQGPIGIAALDLDLDGRPDLAVADAAGKALLLFHNDGALTFSPAGASALDGTPTALAVGHLNCDAAEDLLVTTMDDARAGRLLVFHSEGQGGVAPPQSFAAGMGPASVAAGDLDGAGAWDAVVVARDDDAVLVSRNSACRAAGVCGARVDLVAASAGCADAPWRVTAPAGFVRYDWSNGDVGREANVPVTASGPVTLRLLAYDASGCISDGEVTASFDAPPVVTATAERTYGCSSGNGVVRMPVAATVAPAAGGSLPALSYAWTVDAPGTVEMPAASATRIEFPAGTPPGDYHATVAVQTPGGCVRAADVVLRLVDDTVPAPDPANTLTLRRLPSGGVRIEWGASALVYNVYRGARMSDLGRIESIVAGDVEATAFEDDPPGAGPWYYAVAGGSVCLGSTGR